MRKMTNAPKITNSLIAQKLALFFLHIFVFIFLKILRVLDWGLLLLARPLTIEPPDRVSGYHMVSPLVRHKIIR